MSFRPFHTFLKVLKKKSFYIHIRRKSQFSFSSLKNEIYCMKGPKPGYAKLYECVAIFRKYSVEAYV